MPFAWERAPRIIGHRGAPTEAPENTLASFAAAVVGGADAIELDVRMTRDGYVVVAHDAACGRTVGGEGMIERMTLDELLARDAGAWFGPQFMGERVPLLRDVLEALPRDMPVDVEIKADADNAEELPQKVADIVQEAEASQRVLVTSFDPHLAAAYARISGRPAGAITAFDPDPADFDDWRDLDYVATVRDVALGEGMDAILKARKKVLVWTVNDPDEAKRLLSRGASGIITDRPSAMRAALVREPKA